MKKFRSAVIVSVYVDRLFCGMSDVQELCAHVMKGCDVPMVQTMSVREILDRLAEHPDLTTNGNLRRMGIRTPDLLRWARQFRDLPREVGHARSQEWLDEIGMPEYFWIRSDIIEQESPNPMDDPQFTEHADGTFWYTHKVMCLR
jgi:hypothetical protein